MIKIIIPALFAIIGLLVYALSTQTKVAELGRITYAMGLLVSLFVAAHSAIKF